MSDTRTTLNCWLRENNQNRKGNIMSRYEYKFVAVPSKGGFKVKSGDTFETCKEVIQREASEGWRLKQVVVPFNEKSGVYGASCYQVIFEKEIAQE